MTTEEKLQALTELGVQKLHPISHLLVSYFAGQLADGQQLKAHDITFIEEIYPHYFPEERP